MTDNMREDRSDRFSAEPAVIDGVCVVTVRGEVDHAVKDLLTEALRCEDAVPPRIVVDLGGVTFMDSSGINVLIAAHQRVAGARGWLRIAGAQESVRRLLRLVGVDALIPCHAGVEQAVHA
ncbi:STAS domain-containing protein [Streptomyces antibioticus]|uniref:STAS domain-containing protein n=1 Tax=Streptomyces antibioticus TaxID=1890 RepID=UPI003F4C243C